MNVFIHHNSSMWWLLFLLFSHFYWLKKKTDFKRSLHLPKFVTRTWNRAEVQSKTCWTPEIPQSLCLCDSTAQRIRDILEKPYNFLRERKSFDTGQQLFERVSSNESENMEPASWTMLERIKAEAHLTWLFSKQKCKGWP